ncbi:MAG: amidohydrolase [Deltaproteobacteria bacterium]|nr:amidohydrolase [Deltaproteobacteria bacterium]
MANKYRLFSGDSHLEISPERWTNRVPAKYRDRAPRLVKLANGGDGIIIEGRPMYVVGLAIAGKPYERHELRGVSYEGSEGAGAPEQRLMEQEKDGVDGEILYTSATNLTFWRGIKNDDAYLSVIRAYNEFLAEEYCAANRERLIALGALPSHSVDAAIKELEYCAKAGLKGMMLNTFPSGKSHPTLEDDRFYQTAIDLKMPLSVHVSMQLPDGPLFKYEKDPGEVAFGGDPIRVLTRFGGNSGLNAVQLLLSGVLDRLPKLKIYWAETQMGWLPYYYDQLDDVYKRSKYWMQRYFDLKPLERQPSEYFREHFYWGFIYDRLGIRLRYDIGIDKVMWGNDFPHSAGDWPNSRKVIADMFSGVPEDEKQKMLVDNTVNFFHLN